MDFARRQLEKYGWKDGKGLGKNEDGISQALKPKLKRSVAGIGHDAAADFTEHWWKTLYDKAASNVEVEEKNGKTKKIKTKTDAEFEITNNMWKLGKKEKKSKKKDSNDEQYIDYFVKKAVLTNGGSTSNKVDSSDEEEVVTKELKQMTDEELFAVCEGRTAHKGARHGLKALGKLARIEEQEKKLLEQSRYDGYSHKRKDKREDISIIDLQVVENISLNSDTENNKRKKNKKKKQKCHSHEIVPNQSKEVESMVESPEAKEVVNIVTEVPKKKKKRKISTNADAQQESNMESFEVDKDNNEVQIKKSKKKNK